ncbi:hypothetical protein F4818DRAFT_427592 [Hypoxylon cercidicola]|nr:hypothetical protein F4818DRAFT_427592 [Hypoxylon cercidicola]
MYPQHRHLPSLLALSLLTPPALGTFFFDYLRANIDSATWDAALSTPNATGTYPMPGFNISGAFSDAEIPGWMMSIRVSTNRESHLQNRDDDSNDSRYFTGTSISVRAPDALLRDNQVVLSEDLQGGSSWKVRAYVVDSIRDGVDEEARDDDGSCASFLSPACINDWQAAYVASDDSGPVEPEACTRDLGDGWGVWATLDYVPLSAFNGTELFARADTEEELDDNDELYADAVRDIWPVMMVYSSTDANNVTRREQARLTCVRARNITDGSAQPDAAASTMPSTFWLALGALGTSVFLGL